MMTIDRAGPLDLLVMGRAIPACGRHPGRISTCGHFILLKINLNMCRK